MDAGIPVDGRYLCRGTRREMTGVSSWRAPFQGTAMTSYVQVRTPVRSRGTKPRPGYEALWLWMQGSGLGRRRVNTARPRQSRPDSGRGFQVNVVKPIEGVPSSLRSGPGYDQVTRHWGLGVDFLTHKKSAFP